ncbi:MAG: SulP family inorganic anion transporter [Bacteroidetes bacterium]|nr:SulP family inorganic anion transporter [Bacteroidota bacterium]
MLKPKIITTIKELTREQLIKEVIAGLIVGIVALPLAIAFGIASGVTPQQGIMTAIVGGFVVSFLGGSRVQIGGPTGAFIVIIYAIIQQYGLNGLIIATLMAGIILMIMGFARLGSVIKFIPYPVIVGFTSGIAVVIFSSEVKDFLGLNIAKIPADFTEKWIIYFKNFDSINHATLLISLFSLLIMTLWPKVSKKIPGSIIAIILTTFIVQFFHLNVETIGSRFGNLPSSLPTPMVPHLDLATIRGLIGPATTIAILAAIESLLSAIVSDGMIGGKHRSNMELVAQGAANVLSPLFGGIPVTGAIARTVTNIKNGGRTPVAGIIHAIVLLLILLFFGKLANLIPMGTLAAILVIVAYNMSEWHAFKGLLKSPRSDVVVLLTTFFLTVIFDLTIAIEIGMVLAVLLFMRRMAMVTNVGIVTREFKEEEEEPADPNAIFKKNIPQGVEVYEVNGPFFFGAASKFKDAMREVEDPPKVRIIRMRNVPAIDATGIQLLKELHHDSKKEGTAIIFSGVHAQPLFAFTQAGLLDVFGEENILGNIDDALDRAREILGLPKLGRPNDFVATVKREM